MAEGEQDSGSGGGSSLLDQLPTDQLMQAGQRLLKTAADRAVEAALSQVEGLADRLTGVAENGGVGLQAALNGGREAAEGGSPVTGALKGGLSAVKDKVMGAVGLGGGDSEEGSGDGGGSGGGAGGGGRGKFKFMNIVEEVDVGVPIRVAYDQWTQFADFPTFMKKVSSVEQESDEKTEWRAQVFWSKRTWTATILEQIPDTHIVWRSSGAKGYVNGIVSFHELAPNLTRVLLVLEYYPIGLFEKTGNLWRAVGRRARLEFKHYRRHVMVQTLLEQDELEGWRGEIRDSEVVKTHEEAMEEERRAAEGEDGDYDSDAEYEEYDEDVADEDEDADEDDLDEADEDEIDDEYDDYDEADDIEDVDDEADDEIDDSEDEDYDVDAEEEDYDDEPDAEYDDEPADESVDDEADDVEEEPDERPARRGSRRRARAGSSA
ncbi:SRPBCC family protein [Pseudonocardia nematodicida]|uniref:SRPBCC family protein n=1 Tax=Pseudonocardia nematodicida TaxID=1206997 RepID=A0ABV1KJD0_9PSEU